MNMSQKIDEARQLLELPERATMKEIKSSYRSLLAEWHPDRCREDEERCNEMTIRIIAAYRTIIRYCNQYQYSFSQEEIRNYLPEEEWWLERFGNGSVWSNNP